MTSSQDVNIGKLAKTAGDLWIFFSTNAHKPLEGVMQKAYVKSLRALEFVLGIDLPLQSPG